jgi:hypothetical protein
MATALAQDPLLSLVARESLAAEITGRHREYHCECGLVLGVFGGGRHRVYFNAGNTRLDDPIMGRVCPGCGLELPGKN